MEGFDLRAMARQVIDDDTSEDLGQIVKELRRRIPEAVAGDALDQALVPFVHDMIRQPWRSPARESGGSSDGGRTHSAKRDGIREAWRRLLETVRYTVADASVRRLGDMDRDDLIFVAQGLDEQAAQMTAKAARLRGLDAAMEEHGAQHVRDLPDDVLREMLG